MLLPVIVKHTSGAPLPLPPPLLLDDKRYRYLLRDSSISVVVMCMSLERTEGERRPDRYPSARAADRDLSFSCSNRSSSSSSSILLVVVILYCYYVTIIITINTIIYTTTTISHLLENVHSCIPLLLIHVMSSLSVVRPIAPINCP